MIALSRIARSISRRQTWLARASSQATSQAALRKTVVGIGSIASFPARPLALVLLQRDWPAGRVAGAGPIATPLWQGGASTGGLKSTLALGRCVRAPALRDEARAGAARLRGARAPSLAAERPQQRRRQERR